MALEYRIISIGTLAAHPLWNEKGAMRTAHATTVLIQSGGSSLIGGGGMRGGGGSGGGVNILVDPSLPAAALLARLSERTNVKPHEITHVFLTSFEADRRRAIHAFENATWLIHEPERETAAAGLAGTREEALEAGDEELVELVTRELELLERLEAAGDSLAAGVDLFPLPGVTPGTCGLLLSLPASTVVICGDAIPTLEHLAEGKVLPYAASIAQAQESFREAVEIADVLILGRDNVALNPLRRM